MAELDVRPVTSDRWDDLLVLFGDRGAYSGCWCMWFRVRNAVWQRNGNEGNRRRMRAIVAADRVPGLLGYRDGLPVGWVSVAPRRDFERIVGEVGTGGVEGDAGTADVEARAQADADVDAGEPAAAGTAPIWSIVCFYIDRHERGKGVATSLLGAAIDHARANGARTLEAYPIEPDAPVDNASAFTGLRSMYEAAGFRETGRFERWRNAPIASGPAAKPIRRPPGRPVMRLSLSGRRGRRGKGA